LGGKESAERKGSPDPAIEGPNKAGKSVWTTYKKSKKAKLTSENESLGGGNLHPNKK